MQKKLKKKCQRSYPTMQHAMAAARKMSDAKKTAARNEPAYEEGGTWTATTKKTVDENFCACLDIR
jgi:hypothetical protein